MKNVIKPKCIRSNVNIVDFDQLDSDKELYLIKLPNEVNYYLKNLINLENN